jgi:DNA-binding response OmpR family regulator
MEGFEVYASEDGADGLEKLKTIGADAVVLDLKMPRLSGLDFLKAAHNLGIDVPILVLTGHGGVDEAV